MIAYCPLCGRLIGEVAPIEELRVTQQLCPQCEAIYLMLEAFILAKRKRHQIGFRPDDDEKKEPPLK